MMPPWTPAKQHDEGKCESDVICASHDQGKCSAISFLLHDMYTFVIT